MGAVGTKSAMLRGEEGAAMMMNWNAAMWFAIGFLSGGVIGWLSRGFVKAKNDPIKHIVALWIIALWSALILADLAMPAYSMPWSMTVIAAGVAGWLFGFNPLKGLKTNGKKD